MNPDLDKIWQHLVTTNADLRSRGESALTSDEMDSFIKENTGGKHSLKDITDVSLRNLGRSFAQGATFGGADELMSGRATPEALENIRAGDGRPNAWSSAAATARDVAGRLSEMVGGSPQTAESMRLKDKLFKDAHPGAAYPAEMSGMVASTLLAPEEAEGAVAAKFLPRVAKGAAVNAGIGATAGALSGEDTASRLRGAGVGGILGGFLGAAVPAGMDAIDYFTDPAKRGYARLQKAVAESGGVDALLAKLKEFTQGGRGDVVRAADLSNDMQSALDYAANNNLGVRQRVAADDFSRRGDRPARFLNDMREVLHPEASGGEGTPFQPMQPFDPNAPLPFSGQAAEPFTPGSGRVDELTKARSEWAKGPTGYGGLPEVAPNSPVTALERTPEQMDAKRKLDMLKSVVGDSPSPTVQAQLDALEAKAAPPAMNPAETIFAGFFKRPATQQVLKEATEAGLNGIPQVGTSTPTVDKLIAMKRRFQGLSSEAYTRGRNDVGQSMRDLAKAFDEHLSENVPGYSAVNAEYAAKSHAIDALSKGADAWTDPESRGIKSVMDKMSPDEINNYRYGMASELVQKLRGPGADAFSNALTKAGGRGVASDASTALQDKLKVIFGSDFNFRVFMKRASLEADMARGESAAGNSMTHVRGAEAGFDPADAAMGVLAANHMTASPTMMLSAGQRLAARDARLAGTRSVAASMEGPLMTKGTPAIDALLQSMRTPPAPASATVPPLLPGAAAGQAAGLFGSP